MDKGKDEMAKKKLIGPEVFLEMAEQAGWADDYVFVTTFERYVAQVEFLKELKESIKEYGMTVTKEYVKGRENLVSNPAITEYNRTATAANGTAQTLLKILGTPRIKEETGDSLDEFLS